MNLRSDYGCRNLQVYIAIKKRGGEGRKKLALLTRKSGAGKLALARGFSRGRGDETKRGLAVYASCTVKINEMSLNGLINIIARFINSPGTAGGGGRGRACRW